MSNINSKIKLRRGAAASAPVLATGEIAYTTDGNDILVGSSSGNKRFPNSSKIVSNIRYDSSSNKLIKTIDGTDSDVLNLSAITGYAPINSPAFTGTPTAPTPTTSDNSTKIATTQFVKSAITGYAPINSPAFTGTPTSTTPTTSDDSTKIATTQFVNSATKNIAFGISSTPAWNKTTSPGSTTPNITLPSVTDQTISNTLNYIFTAASANASFTAPTGAVITDGDITTASGGTLSYTALTVGSMYECSFVALTNTRIALIMKEWA